MANYLARQIYEGKLDYLFITESPTWAKFKEDIDTWLTNKGYDFPVTEPQEEI